LPFAPQVFDHFLFGRNFGRTYPDRLAAHHSGERSHEEKGEGYGYVRITDELRRGAPIGAYAEGRRMAKGKQSPGVSEEQITAHA
jgi:hypothetical protein